MKLTYAVLETDLVFFSYYHSDQFHPIPPMFLFWCVWSALKHSHLIVSSFSFVAVAAKKCIPLNSPSSNLDTDAHSCWWNLDVHIFLKKETPPPHSCSSNPLPTQSTIPSSSEKSSRFPPYTISASKREDHKGVEWQSKKSKGRKKKLLPVIQLSWLNTSQFIHISGSVFIAVSPLPCLLETGPFVDTVEKLHMLHVVSMLIQESQTLCWFLL